MKYYDRCRGHCCTEISLDLSPEDLKASYELFQRRDAVEVSMSNEPVNGMIYQDIHLIYPMLKFVKTKNGHPENRRGRQKKHWYTCKHYDSKKRECSIYEIRPKMCRTYPDGKVCRNDQCQWKGVAESWHKNQ